MKNTLLIIAFSAFSLSAIAQTNDVDKKLLSKYSIEELNTIKTEKPEEYKLLTYCIQSAWYIQALPKEKAKENPARVGSIKIKDINNINFYTLNIELIDNDYQFFAIEGTDKMLVVKSRQHIIKELNK